MSTQPPGSDLDRLRAKHPLWSISAAWGEPGGAVPEARQIVARRESAEVRAWTEGELSAKIAEVEAARGWPC